jgi:hypothetical protein
MPDRRTFLIGCGGVVAAPLFASLGAHLTVSSKGELTPSSASGDTEAPTLRIDGWESPVDSASDLWVQVNSSWRATWR